MTVYWDPNGSDSAQSYVAACRLIFRLLKYKHCMMNLGIYESLITETLKSRLDTIDRNEFYIAD